MNQNLRVNKTNFHVKGFALGLALKQRRNATRKSPIEYGKEALLCYRSKLAMLPLKFFLKKLKKIKKELNYSKNQKNVALVYFTCHCHHHRYTKKSLNLYEHCPYKINSKSLNINTGLIRIKQRRQISCLDSDVYFTLSVDQEAKPLQIHPIPSK